MGVDVEGAGAKGRFEGCDISMRVHVAAGADPFFTRNTVEASIWCVKCHKDTPHAIMDGRPAYCKVCQAKPLEPEKKPEPPKSGSLFGE